jgi:hypothetical protein
VLLGRAGGAAYSRRDTGFVSVVLIVGPVVLVLVLMTVEHRIQRGFAQDDRAFGCRVRAVGAPPAAWPWLRARWSRFMWARWDDTVLVVRRGPVPMRVLRLPAQTSSSVYLIDPGSPARRGMRPVAVVVALEDGGDIELSTLELSRVDLVGPYLVAASRELPAPARHREI